MVEWYKKLYSQIQIFWHRKGNLPTSHPKENIPGYPKRNYVRRNVVLMYHVSRGGMWGSEQKRLISIRVNCDPWRRWVAKDYPPWLHYSLLLIVIWKLWWPGWRGWWGYEEECWRGKTVGVVAKRGPQILLPSMRLQWWWKSYNVCVWDGGWWGGGGWFSKSLII